MKRIAKRRRGVWREAEVDFRLIFAPLINDEARPTLADAAAAVVGEAKVRAEPPGMGSEDFSFMMEKVPGAYIQVGNGDSAALHNPPTTSTTRPRPSARRCWPTVVERQLGR